MTLTDTGPIVALIDTNEAKHEACRLVLPRLAKPMLLPWPCYIEAMYLLGRELGYPGQKALWRLRSSGQLMIRESSSAEVDRMELLMEQFRDTPMDLADASLVVAAETLGLRRIFTLDRLFMRTVSQTGARWRLCLEIHHAGSRRDGGPAAGGTRWADAPTGGADAQL